MKKRLFFFGIFLLLFVIELLIALFVKDSFIRPYFGDVLVIPLIYFFVRGIFPKGIKGLSLYVFVLGVIAELMQYIDIVAVMGLQDNCLISTLVGRSFSFFDILCYFVGAVPCVLFELFEKKQTKSETGGDGGGNRRK